MKKIFSLTLVFCSILIVIGCDYDPYPLRGLLISSVDIEEVNPQTGVNIGKTILAELLAKGAKLDKNGVAIKGTATYFAGRDGTVLFLVVKVGGGSDLAASTEVRQTDGVVLLTPTEMSHRAASDVACLLGVKHNSHKM